MNQPQSTEPQNFRCNTQCRSCGTAESLTISLSRLTVSALVEFLQEHRCPACSLKEAIAK